MTDTPGAPDPTDSAEDGLMSAVRAMRDMNPDSLMHRMGIEVIEATPERIVATMLVRPELCTTGGILHGGGDLRALDLPQLLEFGAQRPLGGLLDLLERLDQDGVTRRLGDRRVLRRGAANG